MWTETQIPQIGNGPILSPQNSRVGIAEKPIFGQSFSTDFNRQEIRSVDLFIYYLVIGAVYIMRELGALLYRNI